ncbi:MAG: SRPBCC domain-containing protein [Anaerolineae bacterium]|nr:SRPBCC domain-containing protein [Anaerolineae bacterium]
MSTANTATIAKSSTTINAPANKVWDALTNPAMIKQYMFGTTVVSDWNVGDPIVWKGEWQGKKYEDKGKILKMEKEHLLVYSHFSPLSGAADIPQNYHIVTINLSPASEQTIVALTQDNNASDEERQEAEQNWSKMLEGLKKVVEK